MILALSCLLTPIATSAQTRSEWESTAPQSSEPADSQAPHSEDGGFSVQGGLGFTADPDAFLLEFEGSYSIDGAVSFGPAIQIAVDDDLVLVSPTLFTRYSFDLSDATSEVIRPLSPYVQAGLGLTHIDRKRRRRYRDETGFLMNLGMGVDYAVSENVSIGSRMLFNILPGDVEDENFYFSWQVAGLRYHF
jgi:opacity protein-like surface antigen